MRKKITTEIKNEILLILKDESFTVSSESQLCKIFGICIRSYELFKKPKKIKIDRQCKIELLQWVKQRFIETDNSLFAVKIAHPDFLEIMKAASLVRSKN
jgi:hypothetical protein